MSSSGIPGPVGASNGRCIPADPETCTSFRQLLLLSGARHSCARLLLMQEASLLVLSRCPDWIWH